MSKLSSLGVPVEVFIIFLVRNKTEFTVSDMCREFESKYKIDIKYNRMNQILNDFVESGKIAKTIKPNGSKGKPTAYYTFIKIM
jgi:hypothetical protein